MKQKVFPSLDAAVADVPDGARIMFGGFGGAGFPNNLIQALARKGIKNITAISNNCGTRDGELGLMFRNGQISHVIASFPGPHANYFQERFATYVRTGLTHRLHCVSNRMAWSCSSIARMWTVCCGTTRY